jgi:hypothetical protein
MIVEYVPIAVQDNLTMRPDERSEVASSSRVSFSYPLSNRIPFGWLPGISGESSDNADAIISIGGRRSNRETAEEKKTAALPEVTALRVTNIRKASISMPSKLDEMDDLRIDRQNVSLQVSLIEFC